MNGAAPKLSKFASQTLVQKNIQPNLLRDNWEVRHNSRTSRLVIKMIPAAAISVIRCAISSPPLNQSINARSPDFGGTSCVIVVEAADMFIGSVKWPSVLFR